MCLGSAEYSEVVVHTVLNELMELMDKDNGDELQYSKSVHKCSTPSVSLVLSIRYCCLPMADVDVSRLEDGLELEATFCWFVGSFSDDEPDELSDDEDDEPYIPLAQ